MMSLQVADIEAMVRLSADSVRTTDLREAKRYLLEGLASLLGSDRWFWVSGTLAAGPTLQASSFLSGGKDRGPNEQCVISSLFEFDDEAVRLLQRLPPGHPHTCSRVYLTDIAPWKDLAAAWTRLEAGDCLISLVRLDEHTVSSWGLLRPPGAAFFAHRERFVADLTMRKARWLHQPHGAMGHSDRPEALPPRPKEVLRHLLRGEGRRTVARKLGLSDYTVGDYIKQIYRHYNVTTLGELQALAINDDLREE
jgi:DNA-binding CsgD family transcriptional regulator